MGNGRSFLTALVTGAVSQEQAGRAVETVNAGMPHYKCLRGFHLHAEPLTIESGLLTANGKLRRDAIADYFRDSVEELYRTQKASA
jgi:long-chain acyl-CoA synthetase